jgi:hypothetical protein
MRSSRGRRGSLTPPHHRTDWWLCFVGSGPHCPVSIVIRVEHARTEHFTVILRLPQPLSRAKQAKSGGGRRTISRCADWGRSAAGFVIHQISSIVRLRAYPLDGRPSSQKLQFRSCPKQRIWRSFAVLRRTSLATLAQRRSCPERSRRGSLRMTNGPVYFQDDCEEAFSFRFQS